MKMTPEAELTNTELRRKVRALQQDVRELEASLVKSRQIISQLRSSPWSYLPLYDMDSVKQVARG